METDRTLSLREIIAHELERDDLKLPFPDAMAAMLDRMLGNEDLSIAELSGMVMKDAALTTKILNLSNSAFYAGLEKTRTVDRAIARVGLQSIRGFLMASLMKEVFVNRGGAFGDFFLINWRHSLGCAICAKRIAEHLKLRSMAEEAYLLGLVHDIGTIFILDLLRRLGNGSGREQDITEALTREILDAFHPAVGARILERMNFDAVHCRIVETHHAPDRFQDQDDPLFGILQVANHLMLKLGISIHPNREVSMISLPSTGKLGLDPLFIAILETDIDEMLVTMDGLL